MYKTILNRGRVIYVGKQNLDWFYPLKKMIVLNVLRCEN
jgi:hypothetical protein